ncbi:MAG: hypothetical protein UIH27_19350 [Ruminococcus sp.]|nr:hypothetical protein [Ruminococcus sp.]
MIEWIINVLQWIAKHLSDIKDILWIVFTFIATVVAILSYRSAKRTLLQPLRSEVIKRQTELLVNLLDYLDENSLFIYKVDYYGIVELNLHKQLPDYGFVFKSDKNEDIDQTEAGAIVKIDVNVNEENVLSELFSVPVLDTNSDKLTNTEKYENARKGVVSIGAVYTTDKYVKCTEELKGFCSNPFMPSEIQKEISKLSDDIHYNVETVMFDMLKQFIVTLCKSNDKDDLDNPIQINSSSFYNAFIRSYRSHDKCIDRIRLLIREYLQIDKKWK